MNLYKSERTEYIVINEYTLTMILEEIRVNNNEVYNCLQSQL
jgi:hypothetical protein